MKTLKRLWNSWDPQPTWREVGRLTIIEIGVCLVLIVIINAIV